jgi:hypothetical protein
MEPQVPSAPPPIHMLWMILILVLHGMLPRPFTSRDLQMAHSSPNEFFASRHYPEVQVPYAAWKYPFSSG